MGKWQDGVEGTDGMNGSTAFRGEERKGVVWWGRCSMLLFDALLCHQQGEMQHRIAHPTQ